MPVLQNQRFHFGYRFHMNPLFKRINLNQVTFFCFKRINLNQATFFLFQTDYNMKSSVQQESSLFVNKFYRIFKNLNIVFLFPSWIASFVRSVHTAMVVPEKMRSNVTVSLGRSVNL